MKEQTPIDYFIDADRNSLFQLGRELFACPELGFKEVKSNQIITSFLRQNGIPYETGISLTGVRATLGDTKKGYHVALVADMDAIPAGGGEEKIPFHSCGHSIQVAVMLYVMKLLKESRLLDEAEGSVTFLATPAEEYIDFPYREELIKQRKIRYFSGKQNMISQGIFDGVDCVLSAHINGDSGTLFDINSTLAGFMAKQAVFKGQSSHSGAAPHLGRNALHGAGLCMDGLAYLKDQFPPAAGIQIHPVITECAGSVNIVPDRVALETYVRANTLEDLLEAGRRFDNCACHSALALGLTCDVRDKVGYLPLKQSQVITDILHRHMLEICDDSLIVKNVVSGASGDIGDLSFLLPTVQFGFSGIEGRIHSGEFQIVDEENAYINTVKVIYETVKDLLLHKELQVKNDDYGDRKRFYLENWLHEKDQ